MNTPDINHSTQGIQTTQMTERKSETDTTLKKTATNDTDIILPADKAEVGSVAEILNTVNDVERTNVKFELHDELHEYYVTIVNTTTDEVMKEIPPKKMLDMYAAMAEYMGLFIDETV